MLSKGWGEAAGKVLEGIVPVMVVLLAVVLGVFWVGDGFKGLFF